MAHRPAMAHRFAEAILGEKISRSKEEVKAKKPLVLSKYRKERICRLICRQLKTAGKGGYPAMHFFGELRFRRPPPKGLRRQAYIGNLLEVTSISEKEINAFRRTLSVEMKARITEAAKKWRVVIAEFWKKEGERFKNEAKE